MLQNKIFSPTGNQCLTPKTINNNYLTAGVNLWFVTGYECDFAHLKNAAEVRKSLVFSYLEEFSLIPNDTNFASNMLLRLTE